MKPFVSIFILLLCSIACTGCSGGTPDYDSISNYPSSETTSCTLLLSQAPLVSYANVTPDEKKIQSVAIFVHTSTGGFHKFFLTGQGGDVIGSSDGHYTVTFDLLGVDMGGEIDIFVVGNYYGQVDGLDAIVSWTDLVDKRSCALTKGNALAVPLLMWGSISSLIATGQPNTLPVITMQRMVARIDIIDRTEPDADFTLVSALILDAKAATYLMPGGAVSSIPQIENLSMVPEVDKTCTLYAYETTGEDNPKLQIIYIQKDIGRIETLNIKKPTPIERNKYYKIELDTDESGKIIWNLGVVGWEPGEL